MRRSLALAVCLCLAVVAMDQELSPEWEDLLLLLGEDLSQDSKSVTGVEDYSDGDLDWEHLSDILGSPELQMEEPNRKRKRFVPYSQEELDLLESYSGPVTSKALAAYWSTHPSSIIDREPYALVCKLRSLHSRASKTSQYTSQEVETLAKYTGKASRKDLQAYWNTQLTKKGIQPRGINALQMKLLQVRGRGPLTGGSTPYSKDENELLKNYQGQETADSVMKYWNEHLNTGKAITRRTPRNLMSKLRYMRYGKANGTPIAERRVGYVAPEEVPKTGFYSSQEKELLDSYTGPDSARALEAYWADQVRNGLPGVIPRPGEVLRKRLLYRRSVAHSKLE